MKKNIFVIIGSASENSSNKKLIDVVIDLTAGHCAFTIFNSLKTLPHFDPERSGNNPPQPIDDFRNQVAAADAVLICTPEYVFSIPSGLKNAIEWCVATTVFSDKPLGIITASADGEMGHKELQMIMKTLTAKFSEETTLLIRGVKGKVNKEGLVTDPDTMERLKKFSDAFISLISDKI